MEESCVLGEIQLTSTQPRQGDHSRPKYTDTTNVQSDEPMHFIGVTYRNMKEGLLIEAEMTQIKLFPQAAHNSWEPRANGTTCTKLNRSDVSFPSESIGPISSGS